jgi:hypothetical protein
MRLILTTTLPQTNPYQGSGRMIIIGHISRGTKTFFTGLARQSWLGDYQLLRHRAVVNTYTCRTSPTPA